MTGRLTGKRCLVTAAAAGIGRAGATMMAREGANVVATDIDAAKLAELDGTANLTTRRLDVRDKDAVRAAAAEIGRLDALVNCAGFVHHGTILDSSEADWDFAFDLNVKSLYRTLTAFLPAMIEGGGGSVVNIASVASSIKGAPNRALYGATKAAVLGLSKAVAVDFVKQGIRCNAICPGTVETPSWHDRVGASADPEQSKRDFVARQPMGRVGTADEIAALIVYLASDESAFTTGTEHIIDGGWSM